MRRIFALVLFLVLGCSSGNVQTRHSTDLEARKIRRIAVLPVGSMTSEQSPRGPAIPGSTPDGPGPQREMSEVLTRLLYSTMASMPNWQIVSEAEVREVAQAARAPSEAAGLKQIGERVYADAVITGKILRVRERIGDEWGVKSPASVAFVLDLVDVRRGDVIWSARYDETQKSLSENLLAIGDIGQRGVRWLKAEQLMHEGVKKAVAQLHDILVRPHTS
jgi:TolB-like protein